GKAIRIDDVGDDGRELAVLAEAIDVGGRLLWLFLLAFPLAIDAEQGNREPAVLLCARDAAGNRVLAGDETALTVARVAVGVVRRVAEHAGLPGLLVELHDPVFGNVGEQQVAALREIGRSLGPAEAGRDLLQRGGIDPVLRKTGVEDLHRRIGIALVRRERKGLRGGRTGQKCRGGDSPGAGKHMSSRDAHGRSPWVRTTTPALAAGWSPFYRRLALRHAAKSVSVFSSV